MAGGSTRSAKIASPASRRRHRRRSVRRLRESIDADVLSGDEWASGAECAS
jgi:hypothetical protein